MADLRNTAPCSYCRRPMDWLASDDRCLSICRPCLHYLRSAGTYAVALSRLAIDAARARGESLPPDRGA